MEMQCKEFLLHHNERMIELETKINLKADKTVVDTLESNQRSMNTKMEGLAEVISKLNKNWNSCTLKTKPKQTVPVMWWFAGSLKLQT